ncbi:hypothetical protein AM1_A0166 (plasmid) [Acaryochloris marina MBIC11017]|uniref:Uncharacterized protein n=1 Tax=Acaryochloris marina (strain MBIC 11017) TaxID=329726 RepID=A8ZKH3_ACAM1|nr:hypothetical protein AM1_A0166 [Acaryochloris marina MBIC11017]
MSLFKFVDTEFALRVVSRLWFWIEPNLTFFFTVILGAT